MKNIRLKNPYKTKKFKISQTYQNYAIRKEKNMGELVFNGILLVFFLAMTIYSTTIKVWQGFVGARYWPMVILIITVIIFAYKTVHIYKSLPAEKKNFKLNLSFLKDAGVKRLLASFLTVLIYASILEPLGFFLSTIILIMGMAFIIGLRDIGKLLLISFFITLGVYAVFVWGLDMMLPRGTGPIYNFGYWLEFLI